MKYIIIGVLFLLLLPSVCWIPLAIRQICIYEDGVYDCSGMTEDWKKFFDRFGIKNTVIHGYNYYGKDDMDTHCWLELELPFGSVEFECTTLMFSKTSDHYRNCWITVNKTPVMWTG